MERAREIQKGLARPIDQRILLLAERQETSPDFFRGSKIRKRIKFEKRAIQAKNSADNLKN